MKSAGFAKGNDSLSYTALVQTVSLLTEDYRQLCKLFGLIGVSWERSIGLAKTHSNTALPLTWAFSNYSAAPDTKALNEAGKHQPTAAHLCAPLHCRCSTTLPTRFLNNHGRQESSGIYILPFSFHFIPTKHTHFSLYEITVQTLYAFIKKHKCICNLSILSCLLCLIMCFLANVILSYPADALYFSLGQLMHIRQNLPY